MQLVWFKRDLRIRDHAPLAAAAKRGFCAGLFVYETELWDSEELDATHLQFLNESLEELGEALRKRGGQLMLRRGRMPEVLEELHHTIPISAVWSHEETGNKITYDRDRRVARWLRKRAIPWHEFPQTAVIRRLADRDGWAQRREAFVRSPTVTAPSIITTPPTVSVGTLASPTDLQLAPERTSRLQPGGERAAQSTLRDFLTDRAEGYAHGMSSPTSAATACSRLSPYLAWGCLSIKTTTQTVRQRVASVRAGVVAGGSRQAWLTSLQAYESRLSWHCHFMQKLEDEPELEFQNLHRGYDGLREDQFSSRNFDAWRAGETGFPMVDACMRALKEQRWINFRMRALLISFASYHLWLHWRPTAVFLARYFLDFEPGIHFSQCQMQAGTTGTSALRIYRPHKQLFEQDPDGSFVRQHVPALRHVPLAYLAAPHRMPLTMQSQCGCRIGRDYPAPVVDEATAYRRARHRMGAIRQNTKVRNQTQRVLTKHGSRRRGWRRP